MGVAKRLAARSSRYTWSVVQLGGEDGPLVAFDGRVARPEAPRPATPANPWLAPGERWVEPAPRLVGAHCNTPGRCCPCCAGRGCGECLLLGHQVEPLALGRHLARRGAELVAAGLVSCEEAGMGPAEESTEPPGRSGGQLSFGW